MAPRTPRNKVGAINDFGVIDDGVYIQPSGIPEAGMGLFAGRDYAKHALLTEYSGDYITHDEAHRLRDQQLDSHVRVVSSFHLCIDGIREPESGLGAASFANDARNSKINNAVFVTKHDPKLAEDRVFLKAKSFIPKDTEIFVGYGTTYWKIRDMAPHVMLQPPAQDQQAQHAVASPAAHAAAAAAAGQGSPADVLQDGSPTADQQTPLTPAQDSSSSDEDEEDDPELTAGSLALTYSVSMEGGKRRLTVCPTPIPMQQPADSPPGTPTAPQQASPDRASTLQDGSIDWQAQLQGGFERMTISKPARGQQHAHALQSAAQESNPAAARSSADCSSKQVPSRSNFPVQQQPKPSSKPPAGPSSAAAAGSSSPAAARTMLGLSSGFAAAVIPSDEAAELYISPNLLDSESEDDDGSWTPGYKPKKNTEQRCMPNSSRRPARRRRVPNPDLAYNGTWQAAKSIEKW